MRIRPALLLLPAALAVAALSGGAAVAQDVTVVVPVFSQLVVIPGPAGFVSIYEGTEGDSYINEFAPVGQTVEDWTEMVTLTGSRGRAAGDPGEAAVGFGNAVAGNYADACPDSFTAAELEAPPVAGAAYGFAAYLSCGTVAGTDHGESMIALFIAGAEDVYTVQWAERMPASGTAVAYDPGRWDARLQVLTSATRLCPRVEGEVAPYPSCTGG
ncbi:MAG: hypothetical protein N2422_12650 [Rhodobacteraceae bacterium]|nr:hypothetical protein [Paracoccaceae bacterium]